MEFVVACRRGKEHDYDIVEGPMVDDQIWDYVEDYSSGKISKINFAFTATPKNKTLEMFGEKMFDESGNPIVNEDGTQKALADLSMMMLFYSCKTQKNKIHYRYQSFLQ